MPSAERCDHGYQKTGIDLGRDPGRAVPAAGHRFCRPEGQCVDHRDHRVPSDCGEDISGARQAAVSAALEQALVNAVAQVVSPQVFAANLAFLYDRILPSAQEYVVLFKVLGEATHKNRYLVGVESRINLAMLEQTLTDAGIINVDTGRPAVLLLIAEQTPGDVLPRYWWGNNPAQYQSHAEMRIAQILEQNRFKMVGMGQERPVPASYDVRFPSIYDKASAMDLAERLNADLVVIGRAGATESINRMGDEKIFDAVIHLEALDVKARQPLTEVEHRAGARSDATGPGDVQALIQAADLRPLTWWRSWTGSGHRVREKRPGLMLRLRAMGFFPGSSL
jgi:hypothetical protein